MFSTLNDVMQYVSSAENRRPIYDTTRAVSRSRRPQIPPDLAHDPDECGLCPASDGDDDADKDARLLFKTAEQLPYLAQVYQVKDGTMIYFEPSFSYFSLFYVKLGGKRIESKRIPSNINHIEAFGNALYFESDDKKELVTGTQLYCKIIDGNKYVYRMWNSTQGILAVPNRLDILTMRCIYRNRVVYTVDGDRTLVRATESAIVIELSYALRITKWKMYAPSWSNFIYITNSHVLVTFDTNTMTRLPTLAYRNLGTHFSIDIVGIFNGMITMKAVKSGEVYLKAAQLPAGYFDKTINEEPDDSGYRGEETTNKIHTANSFRPEKNIIPQENKLETETKEYSSKFFNEFTVVKFRGEGGFGCVFEVVNKMDEGVYAIKRVAVNEKGMQKALNEVRVMARLDHPGIVGYKDSWIEKPPDSWQYNADAEMLEKLGLSRRRLLNNSDDCIYIYIKMQGCVIFYKSLHFLFAGPDLIKLCDLGIATDRNDEDEFETFFSRTNIGTMLYMSPEQLTSLRYSSKTDVFSLGLILAELSIVMRPTEKAEIFNNYRLGKQCKNITDKKTADFIERLTQLDPANRPTCRDMLDHLLPDDEQHIQNTLHQYANKSQTAPNVASAGSNTVYIAIIVLLCIALLVVCGLVQPHFQHFNPGTRRARESRDSERIEEECDKAPRSYAIRCQ